MKICFRNISSAKLKWKECSRRIKYDCFFCILIGSSSISFSTTLDLFFLVFFFFCQLLPSAQFLERYQSCNVTNFCIISNLLHHKYNDTLLERVSRNPVSLRTQFLCEPSFPANPVSLRNQFPCAISFPAEPAPLRNQFPREISSPAKPMLDAEGF